MSSIYWDLYQLFLTYPQLIILVEITAVAAVIAFILFIVTYICRSISLFSIGKKRGVRAYGVAWVPLIWVRTLGAITDKEEESLGKKTVWRKALFWLLIIGIIIGIVMTAVIAAAASSMIFFGLWDIAYMTEAELNSLIIDLMVGIIIPAIPFIIGAVLVFGALQICTWVCFYKLFRSCRPEKSVKYLLLSLLVPFAFPVILLMIRKYGALPEKGDGPDDGFRSGGTYSRQYSGDYSGRYVAPQQKTLQEIIRERKQQEKDGGNV